MVFNGRKYPHFLKFQFSALILTRFWGGRLNGIDGNQSDVMERFIILLRHGESTDRQAGQTDFERTLTERGERSILQLGDVLMNEKIFPDIIFSSNAVRTVQTTEAVSSVHKNYKPRIMYEPSLYQGTYEEYQHHISKIELPYSTLMVVGHNPSISVLISSFTNNYIKALQPGQAALIQINDRADSNFKSLSGNFIKLIGPFLRAIEINFGGIRK